MKGVLSQDEISQPSLFTLIKITIFLCPLLTAVAGNL